MGTSRRLRGRTKLLAIVAAAACDRVSDTEDDTTFDDSRDTEITAGFGRPIDDPELLLQPSVNSTTGISRGFTLIVLSAGRSCSYGMPARNPSISLW